MLMFVTFARNHIHDILDHSSSIRPIFSSQKYMFNDIYIPSIRNMPKEYIVFVRLLSVHPSVRPSICPDVIPSVNPFYNQVLLQSFLITYNSAATVQKLFIFGMGVPGRVLFHSTSMNPWVMPQGRARGQNLGHPNTVVYCSLFIQTTSY